MMSAFWTPRCKFAINPTLAAGVTFVIASRVICSCTGWPMWEMLSNGTKVVRKSILKALTDDNIPHIGQPVHEHITRDAITNVTPAASVALIANLQRGVQNADIIHQFDSESHFDDCSVALNVGFSNGFATMNRRFASARPNALNNPEFLAPHCTSFLDISANVVAVLTALANDPECLVKPACPTSRAAAERHLDRQLGAMVFQKDKETVQKLAEVIAEARKELARGNEAAASGQADDEGGHPAGQLAPGLDRPARRNLGHSNLWPSEGLDQVRHGHLSGEGMVEFEDAGAGESPNRHHRVRSPRDKSEQR